MPLPFSFSTETNPNMTQLDANFGALGMLVVMPCVVAGTNALTLTLLANTPSLSSYQNYQAFSGVAASSNTAAVTATIGGVGALNVYKDTQTGPAALIGGEIIAGNAIFLIYDSALNSGAGGFHLIPELWNTRAAAGAAPATVNNNAGVTLTAAELTGSGSGQAIILRTGAPGAPFSDQTDTATAIIASIPQCLTNSYFRFRVNNTTGQTQTLTAGSGVTVNAPATTATGTSHDFIGVVTNVGTPAVTIYG